MLTLAPSLRPYLMRATFEWCLDQGYTPYAVVVVDDWCSVPREFVRDEQIVFNLNPEATQGLLIGEDALSFKARFSGRVHDVHVPLGRVVALYARETTEGMAFELLPSQPDDAPPPEPTPEQNPQVKRPGLRRIK